MVDQWKGLTASSYDEGHNCPYYMLTLDVDSEVTGGVCEGREGSKGKRRVAKLGEGWGVYAVRLRALCTGSVQEQATSRLPYTCTCACTHTALLPSLRAHAHMHR